MKQLQERRRMRSKRKSHLIGQVHGNAGEAHGADEDRRGEALPEVRMVVKEEEESIALENIALESIALESIEDDEKKIM
ncbi:hypothetical protein GCK32_013819 [Trichostrongylus colubriformis]|uniref:Uncharacterized protein n=1 Tax=Trichostrongylus colubriformis TaxID=6319 RepID=A0AAN8EVA2_TRICO